MLSFFSFSPKRLTQRAKSKTVKWRWRLSRARYFLSLRRIEYKEKSIYTLVYLDKKNPLELLTGNSISLFKKYVRLLLLKKGKKKYAV